MKFAQSFKHHCFFWLLTLYIFLTRAPYLVDGVIPFSFDHGKDSLAIMHMILSKTPALIGPWTSIPGLFFGPGWYYLLAPAYFLSGFNPVSAVIVMIILLIIQVYLAYKYFGVLPAVMMSTAPFWLMITTSAWNPFPMTLVTLVILIVLKRIKETGKVSTKSAFMIGIATGLGFHFSAAYAIFYPIAVAFATFYLKPKLTLREFFGYLLGIIIPFIPQLIFELRHDFVQTRAVVNYFQVGEPHVFNWSKILDVTRTTLFELTNSFLPEIRILSADYNSILKILLIFSLSIFAVQGLRNKSIKRMSLEYPAILALGFIIVPIIGYFFLHFNVWYVYPMMPVVVLLIAKILKNSPLWYQMIFTALLLITPVAASFNYYQSDRAVLSANRAFLPVKEKALEIIREKAAGAPFASYHYVPDIYDFSYQYLYLMEAYQGHNLPTEFSYMPDATPYIVQKPELLSILSANKAKPEKIFYLVEEPQHQEFLDSWWSQQKFSKIVESIAVSEELTLHIAEP